MKPPRHAAATRSRSVSKQACVSLSSISTTQRTARLRCGERAAELARVERGDDEREARLDEAADGERGIIATRRPRARSAKFRRPRRRHRQHGATRGRRPAGDVASSRSPAINHRRRARSPTRSTAASPGDTRASATGSTSGALVTCIFAPSYRIFRDWPARSATMPSSIVSVSFDAYSNGELAVPSPLHAFAPVRLVRRRDAREGLRHLLRLGGERLGIDLRVVAVRLVREVALVADEDAAAALARERDVGRRAREAARRRTTSSRTGGWLPRAANS